MRPGEISYLPVPLPTGKIKIMLSEDGTKLLTITNNDINKGAFIIPNGVTSIGDEAFFDCTDLTLLTLPDGLTSIGHGAFYGCTGLAQLTLPAGLTSIGHGAFYGCTGLTHMTLPSAFNLLNQLYSVDSDMPSFIATSTTDSLLGGNNFTKIASLRSIDILRIV